MIQRFQKATDALYQAFFNGTLAKGTCNACAVGNIVAAAMGATISKEVVGKLTDSPLIVFTVDKQTDFWRDLFVTNSCGVQFINNYLSLEKRLFSLTGYTAVELAKVEYSFETNTEISSKKYIDCTEQEILEDQYKGLCAVFDVLMQLDEVEDIQYKEKLKSHLKLQLV